MSNTRRRVAALEKTRRSTEHEQTVADISALMDELSAAAAGGKHEQQPQSLNDYLEGSDHA